MPKSIAQPVKTTSTISTQKTKIYATILICRDFLRANLFKLQLKTRIIQ